MALTRQYRLTLCVSVTACLITVRLLASEETTFDHEVMAVLSRAGCNMGTCHGNQNGKGDLRLSLRGQSPWEDYFALTHDGAGRRVNRNAPSQSLLLLKPSASVPHQGGQRFADGSREYQILQQWIARGAPGPDAASAGAVRLQVMPQGFVVRDRTESVHVSARAFFDDGTDRDVTELATFEASNFVATVSNQGRVTCLELGEVTVSVRYLNQQASVRIAFVDQTDQRVLAKRPIVSRIDRHIDRKLEQLGIDTQPLAPDHLFLRRAYLDTLGRLPSAAEALRFARDRRPDRHHRQIDRLLSDPSFADQWALKWSDLLRNEEKMLDPQGVDVFYQWIRRAFADATPLDQFVYQLIAARGSTYKNPPANFYRSLRDPLTRGEATARLFLGIRLQCAKCHNHPFDRWTQDDYYSWAGLFAGIDYEIVQNERLDRLDKTEFVGEQIVVVQADGKVINARTSAAATPRYLGTGKSGSLSADADPLTQLAAWLTADDNHAFARAQVNRIWYHLMGRGLVDPVDDFRITNPASHPALLDELTIELVNSGFDLRKVIRDIMLSAAYQADAVTDDEDDLATQNYAGVVPRRMTAEQLLDAQCQVLDTVPSFNGYPSGVMARQVAGTRRVRLRDQAPSEDDRFLVLFGKPSRQMSCECERSDGTTLAQAFYLINGSGLQRRLAAPRNRLAQWAASERSDVDIVKLLFWTALSRRASDAELAAAVQHMQAATSRWESLQDLAWALLNAKEFVFRQ